MSSSFITTSEPTRPGNRTERRRGSTAAPSLLSTSTSTLSRTGEKDPLVLVIDGEVQIRRLLRVCLERSGYAIIEASTGKDGIDQAVLHPPNLILLELELPDMDGLQVLRRVREWSEVPILVVSSRDREDYKISALDGGANDYLTKPFSTGELLARLRVLRRYAQLPAISEVFKAGDLQVDLTTREVKVKSKPVKLTATEYALLHYFVRHAGKVLTHNQILKEVWGIEDNEKAGPLRVYMGYLREKLEADPAKPALLVTEPGVGYRLRSAG